VVHGTGKAGDRHNAEIPGRPRINVPAIVSGFAKGELTRTSEQVHCRTACCKSVTYFL